MTDRLDLPARYREQLEALLREHVPGVEVWAYGSRVAGESHEGSDLDLVLRSPTLEPLGVEYLDLIEALERSNIPILVQVHDWARLPEGFHREIERDYVVVQEAADRKAESRWHKVALGKLVRNFDSRRVPLSSRERAARTGSYPYYGATGVMDYVNDYLFEGLHVLVAEDGSVETPGGKPFVQLVDGQFWVNNHAHVLQGSSDEETRYLYYALSTVPVRPYMSGSVQAKLSQSNLNQIPVPYPSEESQRRAIAHVLGTLDDRIELNRRMNETLEAMARALFKSWFVDFDPVRTKMEGHWRRGESLPGLPAEHYDLFPDRLVSSELGDIPEGWEVKALGAFGNIVTGKTPSTKRTEYYGEDVPFLRIPDMHGKMYALKTELMLSIQGAESQSRKTLPPGSVSVSCIATPGLVVLNHRDTHTNQQINSIIPHDQSVSRYLYWTCSQLSSDIATGGLGGSVFGNMNKSTFSALLAIHPEWTVILAFDTLVAPIHTAILANEKQAQALAAQRDALLPRLVSGEVGVGHHQVARRGSD